MENITDADDTNGNLILKDFEIKNLGEYFNLCFQSDTLLLADVLDNFRNMCLEINELDPAPFVAALGLS